VRNVDSPNSGPNPANYLETGVVLGRPILQRIAFGASQTVEGGEPSLRRKISTGACGRKTMRCAMPRELSAKRCCISRWREVVGKILQACLAES